MLLVAILLTKIFCDYHTVFIIMWIIGFTWSPGTIVHWGFTQPAGKKKQQNKQGCQTDTSSRHFELWGLFSRKAEQDMDSDQGTKTQHKKRGQTHSMSAASHMFSTVTLKSHQCPVWPKPGCIMLDSTASYSLDEAVTPENGLAFHFRK